MNKTKWMICFVLLIFCSPLASQQQEKIRESVSVINVEVPVRVLLKGKPIDGLKKEDFELFVGRQKVPIHGFNVKRRKIQLDESRDWTKEGFEPRLFLLIFNVADYNFELQEGLDHLFSKIIKKGDRLIVFTNNFYLRDHTINDLDMEKNRIEQALKEESKKILKEIHLLESKFSLLLTNTKSQLFRMTNEVIDTSFGFQLPKFNDHPELFVSYVREFYDSMVRYFEEYKRLFFRFKADEIVKISQQMAPLNIEKWGFSFYQIAGFPRLKPNSWMNAVIRLNYSNYQGGNAEGDSQHWGFLLDDVVNDANIRMDVHTSPETVDLSRLFINTKITFHTLLMRFNFERGMLPNEFEYKSITDPAEEMIRTLTKVTGGLTLHSNNYNVFIDKVTMKEDIIYILTYDKAKVKSGQDGKIRIGITGKNIRYKLLFNPMQHDQYLKDKIEIIRSTVPNLRIREIKLDNRDLKVTIEDIYVPPVEEFTNGRAEISMLLLDSGSNPVAKRKSNIEAFQNTESFNINLGEISNGNYDLIFEVKDLLSGKKHVVMVDIKVNSQNIILGKVFELDSSPIDKNPLKVDVEH